jgi:hypothetical protein
MRTRKLGVPALFSGVLTGNDVTRRGVPSGARMHNWKLGFSALFSGGLFSIYFFFFPIFFFFFFLFLVFFSFFSFFIYLFLFF